MRITTMSKTYSELIRFPRFKERFEYLKTNSVVGEPTFGGQRYLNQILYQSYDWKKIRKTIILRDRGFDLAHPDVPIGGQVYVHHINPVTIEDIFERRACVFDPENLISCSFDTHNAIHYGHTDIFKRKEFVTRSVNDTCPWR